MYKILHSNELGGVSRSENADEIQLMYGGIFITMTKEEFIELTKSLNEVATLAMKAPPREKDPDNLECMIIEFSEGDVELNNRKEILQFDELISMSLLLMESEWTFTGNK